MSNNDAQEVSPIAARCGEEKMSCRYTPTVMDGPVVRFGFGFKEGRRKDIFTGDESTVWSAEINASRNGVSMQGRFPVWSNPEDVYAVRDMLTAAYAAHRAIRDARDPHEAAKSFVESHNRPRGLSASEAPTSAEAVTTKPD